MAATDKSWQDEYRTQAPRYERLREEVLFTLENALAKEGIKLHSVTSRVKTLESLTDKCDRKEYTKPLEEAPDIVGARVAVLFLSDLSRAADVVSSVFRVINTEDKVEGDADPSTFGYMSRHFEALLPSTHAGPRYDDLQGIKFEVQVRTLLMDAWANVSHYLAYKGESSIPEELRRDFYALSGLFYVADKHFELFFGKSDALQQTASELLAEDSADIPLNLETLQAFLEKRFPDRRHSPRSAVAKLADELLQFGNTTIGQVAAVVDHAEGQIPEPEDREEPYFTDVGVVRTSLRLTDTEYANFWKRDADSKLRLGKQGRKPGKALSKKGPDTSSLAKKAPVKRPSEGK